MIEIAAPLPQREVVRAILRDGGWHSVRDLAYRAQRDYGVIYSETGISARLRELRHAEHGGCNIEASRTPGGHTFVYRMR